jgi:hypothetical protein
LVGDVLNNSGGGVTFEFKTKFGGTTVLDTSAVSIASGANRIGFKLEAYLANLGATNSQYVSGFMSMLAGSAPANGIIANYPVLSSFYGLGQYTGLAIDTTTAQTLAVTVQMGSANASAECRLFTALLEQIQP